MDDLTIMIKTFHRPGCLNRLLKSIRKYYPEAYIIVADDSKDPGHNDLADKYFKLPFDEGLSKGRNFLLDQTTTKYFMYIDDDTIFTDNTKIETALDILEKTDIDIVGGIALPASWYGTMFIRDKKLYLNRLKNAGHCDGHPLYDYVPNLFVAKTERVKMVKWDPELKIQEHEEFFLRAKGVLKTTLLKDFSAFNGSNFNPTYKKFRKDREKYFKNLQNQKMGVTKIVYN